MILVFDLDDTLYPEITFVQSGFKELALWLEENFGLDQTEVYNDLQLMLKEKGRGEIFNDVLKKHKLLSKQLLKQCIKIYRLHEPHIKLYPEAISCLKRFNHFPLYVVTDGHKLVQANKVKALELNPYIKHAYITYRYGIKNGKPSPYCFKLIAKKENVPFNQIIYIADNPTKDFVGIKPLGFKTIRLLQGNYKDLKLNNEHEAHFKIDSLNELTPDFISTVFKQNSKDL